MDLIKIGRKYTGVGCVGISDGVTVKGMLTEYKKTSDTAILKDEKGMLYAVIPSTLSLVKDDKPSAKMNEFLDKVDHLCFEYGYEFYPTIEGWTGRVTNGQFETFACIGNDEQVQLMYIDGDGRGK
jgi:hypothetical protein